MTFLGVDVKHHITSQFSALISALALALLGVACRSRHLQISRLLAALLAGIAMLGVGNNNVQPFTAVAGAGGEAMG